MMMRYFQKPTARNSPQGCAFIYEYVFQMKASLARSIAFRVFTCLLIEFWNLVIDNSLIPEPVCRALIRNPHLLLKNTKKEFLNRTH